MDCWTSNDCSAEAASDDRDGPTALGVDAGSESEPAEADFLLLFS